MPWLYLLTAAALEIVWATGLKSTAGFTKLWPSIGVISTMAVSMFLLALAARTLPIGTAFAGIAFFGESASTPRLICIGLIVAGIAGLKFLGK